MYYLHFWEKTSPPFILYLDFTVRTTGPLKLPEDSMGFHLAYFRNELTSSKIKSKLGFFFTWVWKLYFSFTSSSYQTTYLWHTGEGCDQPNRFAKHRMEQQHWEPTKTCFFVSGLLWNERGGFPIRSWEAVKYDSIISIMYTHYHSNVQLNWNTYLKAIPIIYVI